MNANNDLENLYKRMERMERMEQKHHWDNDQLVNWCYEQASIKFKRKRV